MFYHNPFIALFFWTFKSIMSFYSYILDFTSLKNMGISDIVILWL